MQCWSQSVIVEDCASSIDIDTPESSSFCSVTRKMYQMAGQVSVILKTSVTDRRSCSCDDGLEGQTLVNNIHCKYDGARPYYTNL